MKDRARIADVAARAGVSPGTVSNVFNRPERVTPATRARVVAAVDELGYVPHPAARQLRVGKSGAIGLVVLDTTNPYFMELTSGAEVRLREAGYMLVLCHSSGDLQREADLIGFLARNNVEGIILTPSRNAADLLPLLREVDLPAVIVGSASTENLPHHTVAVDDVLGGRLAVSHLLDIGASHIVMLNDPFELPHCRRRWDGACAAARAHGLEPGDILREVVLPSRGVDAAEQTMSVVLTSDKQVDAVFCVNDITALGAMRAIEASGRRIPEDIQVIGFDDISFARDFPVPLTTIRQPIHALGSAAADLLLSSPDDGHQHVEFLPELVIRSSTVAPRT